jgi:hypothetical protein
LKHNDVVIVVVAVINHDGIVLGTAGRLYAMSEAMLIRNGLVADRGLGFLFVRRPVWLIRLEWVG